MKPKAVCSVAPVVVVCGVAGGTVVVLRRLEEEYGDADTLSGRTVAAMHAAYAAYVLAMAWAAYHRIWPVPLPAGPVRNIGGALSAAGVVASAAGMLPFDSGRQLSGIDRGSLHTTGAYRYSRNPQYLGIGLTATGLAAASRSALVGVGAAGVWWIYRRWIPNEERHLARVFGNQYLSYLSHVRRWFGQTRWGPGAAPCAESSTGPSK